MNKPHLSLIEFNFVAVDRSGRRHQGHISSSTASMARLLLRRQGMVRVLRLRKQRSGFSFATGRIKPADIASVTRQLSTLLNAGVPLLHAFDIIQQGLAQQRRSLFNRSFFNRSQQRLSHLLAQLSQALASGLTLADAMRQHPAQFSTLYCALIDAGERSGSLDVMLERLAQHLEKTERIRQQIHGALAYPTAVLVVAGLVTTVLLLKVVPTFADIFASFGATLPAATTWVIRLSQQLQTQGLTLLFVCVGLAASLQQLLRRSLKWQRRWQRLQLHLPLFGGLLHRAALARYARTLSTTFGAGVPLVNALQSSANAAGNWVFQQAIDEVGKAVTNGTELAQAMRRQRCFPPLLTQLVAIGEQSGTLDTMLAKAADIFESAVDQQVKTLTSLLEPAIMTLLGLLVGGLVVSMYLPIFRLGAVIG